MHFLRILPGVILALACGSFAEAQTYEVTSGQAEFRDGARVVAKAAQGLRIYVLKKKDGWLKAVEPESQTVAWISESAVRLRPVAPAARAEVGLLLGQMGQIEDWVNSESATSEQLQTAIQWAERIQSLLGDHDPITATALEYAGLVAQNNGAYSQAETFLRQALKMRLAVLGRQDLLTAKIHLDLAHLQLHTGELKPALLQAKEAFRIRSKALGNDHPDTVATLLPLALAMDMIDDHETSFRNYSTVYTSFEKHLGKQHLRTLSVAVRAAEQLEQMDQKHDAAEVYREVISILEDKHPKETRRLAFARFRLAAAELNVQDVQAVSEFRERLEAIQKQLPQDGSYLRSEQKKLVGLLMAQGQTSAAFQLVDQMLRQLRVSIREQFWGMSAEKQAHYLAFADGWTFYQALSLARDVAADDSVTEMSSEWLINGKGLVPEAQATQSGSVLSLQRRNAWAAERWVTLAELRSNLPAGAVYVDIVSYMDFDFDEKLQPVENGQRYAAWVVRPKGEVQVLELGPAKVLEDAVADLQSILVQATADLRDSEDDAEPWNKLEPALQTISRLVWHPIQQASDQATRMVVSPDAATWMLPWSALLNQDGTFAIETHQFQMVLSGRDLARVADASATTASVILADPAFDETISAAQSDSTRAADLSELGAADVLKLPAVPRLQWSAPEARAIRPALSQLTGTEPVLLLDNEAQETAFKNLQSPHVVVVSTHGFSLAARSSQSNSGETRSASASGFDLQSSQNPLLQCGLMLTGANRNLAVDALKDDGVLTGMEIASTNLQGTQLAVLSACETGLGRLDATSGVVGLRRAFRIAGARSVLASLWSVPDLDTAVLMQDFFENLSMSRDTVAALQAAQQKRIKFYRSRFGVAHPWRWAAFTLTGAAEF